MRRTWERYRACGLLTIVLASASSPHVYAQPSGTVALNAAGLVSVQPVDGTFVGPSGPYLSQGLGGVGPGIAAGLNVVTRRRMALVFEYSTAWLSTYQQGRLVPAGVATSRLHDAMLTALVGADLGGGLLRTQLLAGISQVLDGPTSNGEAVDKDSADSPRPQAFTFGVDIVRTAGSRANLFVTARMYPWVGRSQRAQYLGIGTQVFRAGVGVRLGLGQR